jgi:hypothetical protein
MFRWRTITRLVFRVVTRQLGAGAFYQLRRAPVLRNRRLAGNPRWWPLIFSAIGDLAFFTAGHKLENNLFAADQAGPSVILGGRKDQPVTFQNFVCPALGEDLITPIRIHFQRRSLAIVRLSSDFNAHAIISSRKDCLRLNRRAAKNQTCGA